MSIKYEVIWARNVHTHVQRFDIIIKIKERRLKLKITKMLVGKLRITCARNGLENPGLEISRMLKLMLNEKSEILLTCVTVSSGFM
jgi:hypothetical protein